MVAERNVLDLEDKPDLTSVVRVVNATREPVTLREGGVAIATVNPTESESDAVTKPRSSFLDYAGALEGLIDDDFVEQNYRQRRVERSAVDDV